MRHGQRRLACEELKRQHTQRPRIRRLLHGETLTVGQLNRLADTDVTIPVKNVTPLM